jgi:hypothetical protein
MSVTEISGARAAGRWVRRGRAIVLVDPTPVQGDLAFEAPLRGGVRQPSEDLTPFGFNGHRLRPFP